MIKILTGAELEMINCYINNNADILSLNYRAEDKCFTITTVTNEVIYITSDESLFLSWIDWYFNNSDLNYYKEKNLILKTVNLYNNLPNADYDLILDEEFTYQMLNGLLSDMKITILEEKHSKVKYIYRGDNWQTDFGYKKHKNGKFFAANIRANRI